MWLLINKNSDISLIRQVYEQIKELILQGKLLEGNKLPSTRWLAENLKVSRNVILEAYDQLAAEGYIESRRGSGTLVAKGIYFKRNKVNSEKTFTDDIQKINKNSFIDFRSGIPALEMFPKREWGSLYSKICNDIPNTSLRYCGPEGTMELRQAILNYLFRVRGISCTVNQIMIISGSTQGLSLISKILFKPSAEVIIEDPIHYGLLEVISLNGYSVNPIQVDENGMRTDMLKASNNSELIYVTPSHQFPLGGVLPIQRRIELIEFAEKNDCYIIEDDYDSEFRYEGQPISSLYELESSRVIYIGSFSKILAPAIRLGYMILPPALISKYKTIKMYTDMHTEAIVQLVLARFINEGKLEKHIWKMKKEYSKKRKVLINALEINFPNKYIIKGQATGLHLVVEFKGIVFTKEVVDIIIKENIKVYPVESYAIHKGMHKSEIILGYGHLSIAEIQEGIIKLKKQLEILAI